MEEVVADEEYLLENRARDEELILFVEEFMNSKEFRLAKIIIEKKDEIVVDKQHKDCVCFECWNDVEKIDLIKRAQRLWAVEKRFEAFLQNKLVCKLINGQDESIRIIRKHIAEAKNRFLCHKEERDYLKEESKKEVLKALGRLYKINVDHIPTTSKAMETVLASYKIRRVQRVKKKERTLGIVKKILNEYKRQAVIDEAKHKRYDTKVIRKEKIMKDMDVVGNKMELLEKPRLKLEEEKQEKTEPVAEPKKVVKETVKEQEQDKAKVKDAKKSKPQKEQNGKATKNKKIEAEVELILPYVPFTNDRNKISGEETQKMGDLVNEFDAMLKVMEEREKLEIEKKIAQGIFYPVDPLFFTTPKALVFQGFKNGSSYRKKLRIHNGGNVEKKCRFYVVSLEEFHPKLIEVEPIGAQSIIPGLFFEIVVTFMPEMLDKPIKGHVVFLTYHWMRNEYTQIYVPVHCIPWCSKVKISPNELIFDAIPIWKAKQLSHYQNYRTLTIVNSGKKPCKITITKIKDSLVEDASADPSLIEDDDEKLMTNETLDKFRENRDDSVDYDALREAVEDSRKFLDECVGYMFNPFIFNSYCIRMTANSEKRIRVYFRNVDHVGSYNDKFLMNVYEEFEGNLWNCVECQEVLIKAEATGKFIEVSPTTMDFNMCVFDSVYQLSFDVLNNGTITHGVGVKFPTCLKSYLSISENDVYIEAGSSKKLSLKFSPSKKIIEKNETIYYNEATNILEFPIQVYLTSKNFSGTPPTKMTAYAILTESNGLTLQPEQLIYTSSYNEQCRIESGDCSGDLEAQYLIDMGECTIGETICTELTLTNNSFVFHNYGFLDLPECVQILPNYGFGEIFPLEIKTLTLTFSPEAKDIPNYSMECEGANNTIVFRITVDTLKNIGRSIKKKKPFNFKFIRKSLQAMENQLNEKLPFSLFEAITTCMDLLREEDCDITGNNNSIKELLDTQTLEDQNYHETELNVHCEVEQEVEGEKEQLFNLASNKIWVKATIIDPLFDLSHQYIEFPDTPCGSYSIMSITLRALSQVGDFKCVCGYAKKFSKCKRHIRFNAHFEIIGNNKEINVEPTCGDLQNGESLKLTLVARPQLAEGTILETAKEIKRQELLMKKRLEWQIKKQKDEAKKSEKKGGKNDGSKSDKGGKSKNSSATGKVSDQETVPKPKVEPEPVFVVQDSEIIINYFDLYPAEMVAWKSMESYYIEARFCCTINYTSEEMLRKPEKLYFTASCKVVQPDFVHDLKTQHIDFGPTAIGMSSRRVINIQNIKCKTITPTMTLLSPTGFFTGSIARDLEVLPEHILQLPVKFSPSEEKEVIEYFEIKAGSTVCSLIASGEGVECNLTITPDFVVCRLQANFGNFADCTIEINNQSKAPMTIEFIKLCELEGEIKPIEKKVEPAATKGKGKGKKPEKEKKVSKFSQALTEEESVSLQNNFVFKKGVSYFEVLGAVENAVDVPPVSKKAVKIHFGVPVPPQQNDPKGKGGKKDNKEKKEKGSEASDKSSGTKQPTGPTIYYVAKYNIMLGKTTFLRDAIIIATFI